MKIVFFGTSEFAVASLRAFLASPHEIAALVTQPDRRKGRRLRIAPPPAKVVAAARGLPVYQPERLTGEDPRRYLEAIGAELFVVVSFGHILPRDILVLPRHGAINLHASLLPRYRGPAPTNWAIMRGEKVTGATIIRLNERMDEGDIIFQREVAIAPADTNITLSERLADIGAGMLVDAADALAAGRLPAFRRQDPAHATYAPKLTKEDGRIDWMLDAAAICDRVRGLLPWPGAYTTFNGQFLKILNAVPGDDLVCGSRPGTIVAVERKRGIVIKAGRGTVCIAHLQRDGGKPLDADAFLRGHRLPAGSILGSA